MKRLDKESLFENYVQTAIDVFWTFENTFGASGAYLQVTGLDFDESVNLTNAEKVEIAKRHMRKSEAWHHLSQLYDYAVDGILPDDTSAEELVIGGADILSFLETEMVQHSGEWTNIVAQGDGRFGLDSGDGTPLDKLALLASVDVRTVRNALSAGDLVGNKVGNTIFFENSSARNWLSGRRGFKPTQVHTQSMTAIGDAKRPIEFGSFLKAQRQRIGIDAKDKKILVLHPSVTSEAIEELEQGVFRLPLDAVFPLADFYQLDRKALLDSIMTIFFAEQYETLSELITLRAGEQT